MHSDGHLVGPAKSVEQSVIVRGRTLGSRLTHGIEMLTNTKGSVAR